MGTTHPLYSHVQEHSTQTTFVEIGFSVTCVILGGQTLLSINNALPLMAAIVMI
jgi:hypothetical protein